MKETTHLKAVHYEAMRDLGYSDEDIEKDWVLFVEEYNQYVDDTMEALGLPQPPDDKHYKPFGSSVQTKKMDDKESWPW